MADLQTTRRMMLGAIVASPFVAAPAAALSPNRSEWDRALRKFQAARALADADYHFGDYHREDEAFEVARAKFVAEFGEPSMHAARSPEAERRWAPIWEAATRSEEVRYKRFVEPLWESARNLAMTPAPDFPAVLIKIEIIKEQELDNDSKMPRDPFELIAEDVARLSI